MVRAEVAYRFSDHFCYLRWMAGRSFEWMLKRLPEVQVIRKGDEVTVIVPKDIHHALVGLLVDEALRRAGMHPSQVNGV